MPCRRPTPRASRRLRPPFCQGLCGSIGQSGIARRFPRPIGRRSTDNHVLIVAGSVNFGYAGESAKDCAYKACNWRLCLHVAQMLAGERRQAHHAVVQRQIEAQFRSCVNSFQVPCVMVDSSRCQFEGFHGSAYFSSDRFRTAALLDFRVPIRRRLSGLHHRGLSLL